MLTHLDDDEQGTFNWATESIQPITSILIRAPVYCYSAFHRATMELSPEELNLKFQNRTRETGAHLLVSASAKHLWFFAVRVYFGQRHFEAVLPIQAATVIAQSCPRFVPHRDDDFADNQLMASDF